MIRRALLVLVSVVVMGYALVLTLAVFGGIPLWAWIVGAVFWTLVLLRRRQGPLTDQPAGLEDGPRFSPTRGGGF